MFVIIIIILLLTELCAGGLFDFFPSVFCHVILFYLPFFSSSPNAQNIVRGLLPQVVNFWNATTSPSAMLKAKVGPVAKIADCARSAHRLIP